MIAVASRGTSFRWYADYLANGRSGGEQDRVAWSNGRNLPTDDPTLAATFMSATAAQSTRVQKPVYHIAVSFAPEDAVDRLMMERVADRILERLRLTEHQTLIVAHRDRPHAHFHLLVNRIHPDAGVAWSTWQAWPVIDRVLREEEKALGLREVPHTLTPQITPQITPQLTSQQERDETEPRQAYPLSSPSSRVTTLAQDLGTYERVMELTRERYQAQIDLSAARARVIQLEGATERAHATLGAFMGALASVYRDPDAAYWTYRAMAERDGMAAATLAMRERPERFGTLVTIERSRAFGLMRADDDGPARSAAAHAAARGRDAIDAARGLVTAPSDPDAHALDRERQHAARSEARARALDAELRSLPARAPLERRITSLIDRMSPIEVQQLGRVVTAPRFAVAMKLWTTLRDLALGRDEDRDHSR
jgi:hypothetical protein